MRPSSLHQSENTGSSCWKQTDNMPSSLIENPTTTYCGNSFWMSSTVNSPVAAFVQIDSFILFTPLLSPLTTDELNKIRCFSSVFLTKKQAARHRNWAFIVFKRKEVNLWPETFPCLSVRSSTTFETFAQCFTSQTSCWFVLWFIHFVYSCCLFAALLLSLSSLTPATYPRWNVDSCFSCALCLCPDLAVNISKQSLILLTIVRFIYIPPPIVTGKHVSQSRYLGSKVF